MRIIRGKMRFARDCRLLGAKYNGACVRRTKEKKKRMKKDWKKKKHRLIIKMLTNSFATRRQKKYVKKKNTLFHRTVVVAAAVWEILDGLLVLLTGPVPRRHREDAMIQTRVSAVYSRRFYSSGACPRGQTKGPETKDPRGHPATSSPLFL